MLYFRVFIVTYSKFIHFVGCRIHHLSFVACRVCGLRAYHDPGTCTCACACTCTAVPSYCLVAATSLRAAECCVCDEKERSLPPTKQLRRSFSPQSEPSPASAASQHCLQPIRCPASPSPPTPPPPLAAAAHVAAVTLAANAAAALAATALAAAAAAHVAAAVTLAAHAATALAAAAITATAGQRGSAQSQRASRRRPRRRRYRDSD